MTEFHGGLSNDLADWFPPIQETGVPVPRTIIQAIPASLDALLDEVHPRDPAFPADAREALEIAHLKADYVGFPLFIRTGEMSGKHSWSETCYLTSSDRLLSSVYRLMETQAMAFGVPAPRHLIFREILNTAPLFFAFNAMPITKERRVIVVNGEVTRIDPYWPIGAIEGHNPVDADGVPVADDVWMDLLRGASTCTGADDSELRRLASQASTCLIGSWTIDFLWTTDRGWVLIDAAHAERSYRIPDMELERLRAGSNAGVASVAG